MGLRIGQRARPQREHDVDAVPIGSEHGVMRTRRAGLVLQGQTLVLIDRGADRTDRAIDLLAQHGLGRIQRQAFSAVGQAVDSHLDVERRSTDQRSRVEQIARPGGGNAGHQGRGAERDAGVVQRRMQLRQVLAVVAAAEGDSITPIRTDHDCGAARTQHLVQARLDQRRLVLRGGTRRPLGHRLCRQQQQAVGGAQGLHHQRADVLAGPTALVVDVEVPSGLALGVVADAGCALAEHSLQAGLQGRGIGGHRSGQGRGRGAAGQHKVQLGIERTQCQ